MADATLQALLSTKAALDLGLVSQEDYDVVKSAFLRAQQLRAAVDAGLMREEDYEATKGEFLASLTLSGGYKEGPVIASRPSSRSEQKGKQEANGLGAAAHARAQAAAMTPRERITPPEREAVAAHPAPKAAPPPPGPPPRPAEPTASGGAEISSTSHGAQISAATGSRAVPTNIPKLNGAKAVSSGVSMSGISVSEDAVNVYYHVRSRSTYKWVLWKINAGGTTVVIDAVGDPGSSYESFLQTLPNNDCRYGVFDYELKLPDGQKMNKLVFLNWAPDSAKVKSKMMYASTKDFFKGHLDGLSAEFQASDLEEISEGEVAEAIAALKR